MENEDKYLDIRQRIIHDDKLTLPNYTAQHYLEFYWGCTTIEHLAPAQSLIPICFISILLILRI